MQFFLFISLVLAMALVFFAFQNPRIIELKFITWTFENSLTAILALVFTAGMITGIFLSIPTWWRKAKSNRVQKKRIQELERNLLGFAEQGDAPAPGESDEREH